MQAKESELETIKQISERIIEAQKNIRILDAVKWDEPIQLVFFKHKAQRLPAVDVDYYRKRPLPFDPLEKTEEFRCILRDTQNQLGQYSPITRLIKRLCDEYIRAVQMLMARGTPAFHELSMELYGSPDDAFYPDGPKLSQMGAVMFDLLKVLDLRLKTDADEKRYSPEEAQAILQERLDQFFDKHPGRVTVQISDDMVADAAAGADNIKLSAKVKFSERDLRYLEVHEGWVHVGTTLNGSLQPYCSFLSKGSPSSSVIQEGLAVITETANFSSYPSRLLKITNRVIAIDKVQQGANFIDIYRYFIDNGFEPEESYRQSLRVFRGSLPDGGPFTKDLSYAKGFVLIYNFLRYAVSQHRVESIPLLFLGKLSLDDIPLLLELKQQGYLTDPVYLPPQFRDLAALSAWLSFSLYLNKFDFNAIQSNFRFLLA